MRVDATRPLEQAASRVWDVIVVGAGPAGAMAALELARLDADVLLVDKAAFPRWKACGCCLNAWGQSTLALAGLGELVVQLGAVPLSRFILAVGGRRTELDIPHSVAISRESLDSALVQAAIREGAHFIPETLAQLAPPEPGQRRLVLRQKSLRRETAARLVLAADGLAGRLIANEPEGELRIDPASRLGGGLMLDNVGESDYQREIIYMGAGRHGYVGLVRLGDGRLNLGAAFDAPAVTRLGGLGPAAAATLEEAGLPLIGGLYQAAWKGVPPFTRRINKPSGERWLALGDAAGYVEPFTGEGMAWALAQGRAIAPIAAEGVREWSSEVGRTWHQAYWQMMAARQKRCRLVAGALRHPHLVSWLMGALSVFPGMADPLVRGFTLPAVDS